MSRDQLKSIFKVKPNTEFSKTGCGIGLAVTKGLIEGLEGDIKVSSIPDSGTIVSFWIRVHDIKI